MSLDVFFAVDPYNHPSASRLQRVHRGLNFQNVARLKYVVEFRSKVSKGKHAMKLPNSDICVYRNYTF